MQQLGRPSAHITCSYAFRALSFWKELEFWSEENFRQKHTSGASISMTTDRRRDQTSEPSRTQRCDAAGYRGFDQVLNKGTCVVFIVLHKVFRCLLRAVSMLSWKHQDGYRTMGNDI